jgi:hypothetical protein
MEKVLNGDTVQDIAVKTGLHPAEISMALNKKRLLGREKLLRIVDAGYPLEPFVFGKEFICIEAGESSSACCNDNASKASA